MRGRRFVAYPSELHSGPHALLALDPTEYPLDRFGLYEQGGRYLLVVNGDNLVEQRKVQIGPLDGGLRVIESGLKPDDRVVTAGLLRVIPGQKVDPQTTKIEASQASAEQGRP